MALHRQAGPSCSTARKPRAHVLPHCTTGACGWCWIRSYCSMHAFSLLFPFLHVLKNTHQKPLEKLWNGTGRDLLGHWTQPPAMPSNPPVPVRTLAPWWISFITQIWMKILLFLSRAPPCSLSYLGAASCKQLQNHFSAQLQNPSCDACKNLDNVLATCVLRLLSIMFINIVSFLLILSRQPVPSVASCDMCRLSSSQQQLTFSSVLVQHLAQPVLIHYRVPQGSNDTEN